jgi:hypothetical protein
LNRGRNREAEGRDGNITHDRVADCQNCEHVAEEFACVHFVTPVCVACASLVWCNITLIVKDVNTIRGKFQNIFRALVFPRQTLAELTVYVNLYTIQQLGEVMDGKENTLVIVAGRVVVVNVGSDPTGAGPQGLANPGTPTPTGADTHSPDFASVRWRGQVYTFSPKQRRVVAALWRAREQGYEWVSTEALLEAAESLGGRVKELFKGHPAWGVLIVSAVADGGTPGTYRLAE